MSPGWRKDQFVVCDLKAAFVGAHRLGLHTPQYSNLIQRLQQFLQASFFMRIRSLLSSMDSILPSVRREIYTRRELTGKTAEEKKNLVGDIKKQTELFKDKKSDLAGVFKKEWNDRLPNLERDVCNLVEKLLKAKEFEAFAKTLTLQSVGEQKNERQYAKAVSARLCEWLSTQALQEINVLVAKLYADLWNGPVKIAYDEVKKAALQVDWTLPVSGSSFDVNLDSPSDTLTDYGLLGLIAGGVTGFVPGVPIGVYSGLAAGAYVTASTAPLLGPFAIIPGVLAGFFGGTLMASIPMAVGELAGAVVGKFFVGWTPKTITAQFPEFVVSVLKSVREKTNGKDLAATCNSNLEERRDDVINDMLASLTALVEQQTELTKSSAEEKDNKELHTRLVKLAKKFDAVEKLFGELWLNNSRGNIAAGQLQLGKDIGSGSSAIVQEATLTSDETSNQSVEVAAKRFLSLCFENVDSVRRVRDEIRLSRCCYAFVGVLNLLALYGGYLQRALA